MPPAGFRDLVKVPNSAAGYMRNAEAYLAAMKVVASEENRQTSGPAYYLLLGFGMEMALKAVCLQAGASKAQLRHLGHHLDAALQHAIKAGIAPLRPTTHDLVKDMSQLHSIHFHTPDFCELSIPSYERCAMAMEDLMTAVRDFLPPPGQGTPTT
jgi:hypothetical protein